MPAWFEQWEYPLSPGPNDPPHALQNVSAKRCFVGVRGPMSCVSLYSVGSTAIVIVTVRFMVFPPFEYVSDGRCRSSLSVTSALGSASEL